MRRFWLVLGLVGLASAAVAQPSELRVGMRDDPDILDPTLSRTYVGTLVMTAMCDKLFDSQREARDRAGAGDRV